MFVLISDGIPTVGYREEVDLLQVLYVCVCVCVGVCMCGWVY